MTDFSNISEEAIIAQIRKAPDQEGLAMDYLLKKYKPLVYKIARKYFLIGGDYDDLLQEGMIGLFKAIRDYDISNSASFTTYAYICIQGQILTAIESAKRLKHQPLNSYISMTAQSAQEEHALEELLAGHATESPEEDIINQEFWKAFYEGLMGILSPMEKKVLSYYRDGKTYTEIAEILGKQPKAIDNALQRIKKKVSTWNFQESEQMESAVSSAKKKSTT